MPARVITRETRWLIGAVVLELLVLAIVAIPKYQVNAALESGFIEPSEIPVRVNEYRKTVIQLVGGLVVAVGLYLTWRRIIATERTVYLSEQGQITERFTRAVEQLGHDKMAVRLGGIYALGRIAKDSKSDRDTVVEILSAYFRDNAYKTRPRVDPSTSEDDVENQNEKAKRADESGSSELVEPATDLYAALNTIADIGEKARLSRSNLAGIKIPRAVLTGADLKGADLKGADLTGAYLKGADLREASLRGAKLSGAILWDVNLGGADLWNAHLMETDFTRADLREADFRDAFFMAANLTGADLKGAFFMKALLDAADLREATLSVQQLLQASSIEEVKIDDRLNIRLNIARQIKENRIS